MIIEMPLYIDKANEYGVILIAPEFSDLDFPSGNAYNLGNIFIDGNNPSPETLVWKMIGLILL